MQKLYLLIVILFNYILFITSSEVPNQNDTQDVSIIANTKRFELFNVNWEKVKTPFTISAWLLIASIAKILFHINKKFGDAIPDSALLIFVGFVLGKALQQFNVDASVFRFNAHTFFLYLLPPIIFDASYFMPNRELFENFDSVILFAVVGTIFNAFVIGFALYFLGEVYKFSVSFSAVEIFIFTSLISAVDPVAVIAVFEEIHVNSFLFINVFGEALFNDGVAVVLYQMFVKILEIGLENMTSVDYFFCFLSFFVIAFGGILIGLFYAVFVCLTTRFSSRVKIVAPVFIFVSPYLAFITADMFEMSSILAITTCGIVMKQYVKGNITQDASSSVKYFVKTLAQSSETVVFMYLGLSTVSSNQAWDTYFVATTVVLCLVFRSIGVFVQCAILNRFRKKKFSFVDQFVLSYGGLRGAIAFGLVVSMPSTIHAKQMFETTCIFMIFFTVFIQGITIRPLINWLKVERSTKENNQNMIEKVYTRYCDYTMTGLENIAGVKSSNAIRDAFERFNAKVLKPALMRHEQRKCFDATDILRAYKKIALSEASKIVSELDGRKKNSKDLIYPSSTLANFESYEKMSMRSQEEGKKRSSSSESSADIKDHLTKQINTEELYSLFSRLLDRKISELDTIRRRANVIGPSMSITPSLHRRQDDIKDNYIEMMGSGSIDGDSIVGQAAAPQRPLAANKTVTDLENGKSSDSS